uniref:Callatostatin-5 n=1 Tax=Calliphora vomitoria TaxID=27454 RepID=ALL5_CALVO|nr:RecName: Full=Callatostatin-5; AltName: Full=Met-callatostatin-1; AltName: Full=[Hyp3]Met-callatostatin [Calliphora vomitoria]AAB25923.1 callatostatin 5=neuropeptide [Calliphora vomitoria=blowflies, whole flies, Peptide, 8 aa] [Calliphora vomitoria]prf//2115414A 2-Hyp Met callatostatin [Calliphora vomitoria]
GPPYDFGM